MSIIHTIARSSTLDNGAAISSSEDVPSDFGMTLDFTVAPGVTNEAHAFVVDRTKLQSWYVLAGQAVVILANSTSTPTNTWNMVAGVAFVWSIAGYFANPLAANLVTLYITNSGTSAARIRIRVGVNT